MNVSALTMFDIVGYCNNDGICDDNEDIDSCPNDCEEIQNIEQIDDIEEQNDFFSGEKSKSIIIQRPEREEFPLSYLLIPSGIVVGLVLIFIFYNWEKVHVEKQSNFLKNRFGKKEEKKNKNFELPKRPIRKF